MSSKKTIKLQDTGTLVSTNSRLDKYWLNRGFENFYIKFRKGLKLPKEFQTIDSVNKLINTFKLNEIGFGNWVTQEDRFNYISALTIALYDINKVCKFKNTNLGLNGNVSFTFGARGRAGALAHFEPNTFIINVTRYTKNLQTKELNFVYSGGAGSVAHEFGHALDYYFGGFVDVSSDVASLSGGNSYNTRFVSPNGPLRAYMQHLLDSIIWQEPYKTLSPYYKRLQANFTGDYFFRRNEIFARAFERYIHHKLSEIGIANKFLHETKYDDRAYLRDGELKKVIPIMDALIAKMRTKI